MRGRIHLRGAGASAVLQEGGQVAVAAKYTVRRWPGSVQDAAAMTCSFGRKASAIAGSTPWFFVPV